LKTVNWLDADLLIQDRIRFLAQLPHMDKTEYNQRFDELIWLMLELRKMLKDDAVLEVQ
jgi:hypothetical protein